MTMNIDDMKKNSTGEKTGYENREVPKEKIQGSQSQPNMPVVFDQLRRRSGLPKGTGTRGELHPERVRLLPSTERQKEVQGEEIS